MRKGIVLAGAILLNIFLYYISVEKTFIEEIIIITIVLTSFYYFIYLVHARSKLLGFLFGAMAALLLAFNQALGLGTFFVYDSKFTYGHGLSILSSNMRESMSMISSMPFILLVFIALTALHFLAPKSFTRRVPNVALSGFCAALWLLVPLSNMFYLHRNISVVESKLPIFLRLTPLYNFRPISQALAQHAELQEMHRGKADYSSLTFTQEGVDVLVVFVGESARRANMSLYGYERVTTPSQDAEQDNMLLYQQMVSPSCLTLLSVPMLLSQMRPEHYHEGKGQLVDNVFSLARAAGYKTYWLSTQEQGSNFLSTVSNLISYADSSAWLSGFDEVLLPKVEEIVHSGQKKVVIFMHVNGSHSNACDKFPANAAQFVGAVHEIDCYDNSILFTDRIIGQVFGLLREQNAAIICMSDHAEKLADGRFFHSDTKEGTEIPYYVWYAQNVSPMLKKRGKVEALTSATVNYYEFARLLGVSNLQKPDTDTIMYLKSDLSVVAYSSLN